MFKFFAGALMSLILSVSGVAMAKPAVSIIVPGPPGGAMDGVGKVVQNKLNSMGYTASVVNKPGAGNTLATRELVSTNPKSDQLIVMVNSNSTLFNYHVTKLTDIDPTAATNILMPIGTQRIVFYGRPDLPANDLRELDKLALNSITYATPGVGTGLHLAGIWISQHLKTPMRAVPYKGIPAGIIDVAGKTVDLAVDSGTQIQLARQGKIKIVAVLDDENWTGIAGVKTIKEMGFPEYKNQSPYVLYGNKNNDSVAQKELVELLKRSMVSDTGFRNGLIRWGISPAKQTDLVNVSQWWDGLVQDHKKMIHDPSYKTLVQDKK